MPLDVHDILVEQGKEGVKVFKEAIAPYRATGKTADSVYYQISGEGQAKTELEILARKFIEVLETGSKPAKTIKPPKEMIDMLTEWAQYRGIDKDAVYGIAVNLLKNGQKVHRNVYSKQMDEWADETIDRITKEFAGYAVDKIANFFKS